MENNKMSVVSYDMINDSIDDLEERKKFLQSKCMRCWSITDELALMSLRFIIDFEQQLVDLRNKAEEKMYDDPAYRDEFIALNHALYVYRWMLDEREQIAVEEGIK